MKRYLVASTAIVAVSLVAQAAQAETELERLKREEAAAIANVAAIRSRINAIGGTTSPTTFRVSTPVAASVNAAPPAAPRDAMAQTFPPTSLAPVAPWAGAYVGFGYSRTKTTFETGTSTGIAIAENTGLQSGPTTTYNNNLAAWRNAGFALAGYNWQFGRLIGGVEGDVNFLGLQSFQRDPKRLDCWGSVPFTGWFGCVGNHAFGTFETLGHLRATLGIEITPKSMAYVTGGLAIGRNENSGVHFGGFRANSPNQPVFAFGPDVYTNGDGGGGSKLRYGASYGGGVQVKTSELFTTRFEYLRDVYDLPSISGNLTIAPANSAPGSLSMTLNPGTNRYINEQFRVALIHQFDPTKTFYQSAGIDVARITRAPETPYNWAGLYVGGGYSQNNYHQVGGGTKTLSFDLAGTPGTDFILTNNDYGKSGDITAKHLIIGARVQFHRFILGVERDWTKEAQLNFPNGRTGPGQFSGGTAPMTCYDQFPGYTACIGQGATNGGFATQGHLRVVAGVELTPQLMAFFSAGRAYGRGSLFDGAGTSGIVADGVSAPLVGAATVTRITERNTSDLVGRTIGGGIEMKVSEAFSLRGEYYRDTFSMPYQLPIGGAGFGGTIGQLTTNSFASIGQGANHWKNDIYRVSVMYNFWNPQKSLMPVAPWGGMVY